MSTFASETPISSLALTKSETRQLEKRDLDIEAQAVGINYFKDNPEARDKILKDPFSDTADSIYPEIYEDGGRNEALQAAVLAQEAGEYDSNLRQLERPLQRQKLYDQIESSAKAAMRLKSLIENNIPYMNRVEAAEMYQVLNETAFKTADESEIQKNFSLSQRRGFRLGIANFIEIIEDLRPYRGDAQINPREFAEKNLGLEFKHPVSTEVLPIAIVVYLHNEDFKLIDGLANSSKFSSLGALLFFKNLPEELRGRLIVLRQKDKDQEDQTPTLSDVRTHEITHVIFSEFFVQLERISLHNTLEALSTCESKKSCEKIMSKFFDSFVEGARNELIAYFTNEKFDVGLSTLVGFLHSQFATSFAGAILENPNLERQSFPDFLKKIREQERSSIQTIRQMHFIARKMHQRCHEGEFDRDYATVLLQVTPFEKFHRLAKYAGFESDLFRDGEIVKRQMQQAVSNLKQLLDHPRQEDDEWWDIFIEEVNQARFYLPPSLLSVLSMDASNWGKKELDFAPIEFLLALVIDYIDVYGITKTDKTNIHQLVDALTDWLTEFLDFEVQGDSEKPDRLNAVLQQLLDINTSAKRITNQNWD